MVRTKQSEIAKRSGSAKKIAKRLSKGMANQGPHRNAAAEARARRVESLRIRESQLPDSCDIESGQSCGVQLSFF